jgi:FAD dependent oxidoreductase
MTVELVAVNTLTCHILIFITVTSIIVLTVTMWRSSAVVSSLKRSIGAAAVVSGGPFVLLLVVALERDDDESTTITHLEAAPRFQPKILVHRPSVVHTTTPSPSHGQILSRQEQIEALKTKHFDVLVVGAGATGGGAALDATTRGLSTALIERGDFGNETSSRSTKLIWAGIRYIATAVSSLLRFKNIAHPIQALSDFFSEFSMVQSAHHERRLLIDNNPHLTKWVPIAVPIKEWISWPAPFGHPVFASAPLTLPAVFKFYDSMSGFTCPPSHIMRVSRAQRKFPQLDETVKYFQVRSDDVHYKAVHSIPKTHTHLSFSQTLRSFMKQLITMREQLPISP